MEKTAKNEIVINIVMRVMFVILAILNTFPFCASNKAFMQVMRGSAIPPYEGGWVVTLITLVLIGAWLYAAYDLPKPKILESVKSFKETGLAPEELFEVEQQKKDEEHSRIYKLEYESKRKIYGDGFRDLRYGIVINNITNKIFIKDIEYSYEDIVDFNTHDNSQVVQSTKTTSTVKNDNGNVAGRALVGGILFGAVGAVVGASTAKKTTEQAVQTEVTNSTLHNYSIEIILNKAQPISKVIQLYDDETALSEISSTLTTIINQNKS